MEPSGIAPKSGIWRASYRRSFAESILKCSENDAHAFASQLAMWCSNAEHFENDCQRVLEEVRRELHERRTADDRLRFAIMDNIVSMVRAATFPQDILSLAVAG